MALFYASLNSGSNGNCYYAGNDQEAVLIDAGIHCAEIESRMQRLGLAMSRVKALFISHEHTDHIRGAYKLAKKYNLPVYLSPGTLARSYFTTRNASFRGIEHETPVMIGGLKVIPFSKKHDASDPYSFVIENRDIRFGVITDIGIACENVIRHFSQCHAAILESNYDEEMLMKGSYPYFLKQRIKSGEGHISNTQAYELFHHHRAPYLEHLMLGHLSKENNHPEIVLSTFTKVPHSVRIDIASRHEESPLYYFDGRQLNVLDGKTLEIPFAD